MTFDDFEFDERPDFGDDDTVELVLMPCQVYFRGVIIRGDRVYYKKENFVRYSMPSIIHVQSIETGLDYVCQMQDKDGKPVNENSDGGHPTQPIFFQDYARAIQRTELERN